MKFIKLLFIFLPLLLCMSACGKDTEESQTVDNLKGTTWKLKGFVDTETGKIIPPNWTDCNECFTITFNTDSTAEGKTYLNSMWVNLKKVPLLGISTMVGPEDETLLESSVLTESYLINNNELKIFYGNKYILYKKIK